FIDLVYKRLARPAGCRLGGASLHHCTGISGAVRKGRFSSTPGRGTAMAEIKAGMPFGMDSAMLSKIDWDLVLKRISHDLRTDFIYAPHLGFIYSRGGDELVNKVKSDLKSGQYSSGLPLTIEVPKSFRIRVAVPSKRLG